MKKLNDSDTDASIIFLINFALKLRHELKMEDDSKKVINAAQKISELIDYTEELRRALKPFAELANQLEKDSDTGLEETTSVTTLFLNFIAARNALR